MARSILFSLFLDCDIVNVVKLKKFVVIYVPIHIPLLPATTTWELSLLVSRAFMGPSQFTLNVFNWFGETEL